MPLNNSARFVLGNVKGYFFDQLFLQNYILIHTVSLSGFFLSGFKINPMLKPDYSQVFPIEQGVEYFRSFPVVSHE
jgi:hypothetical protein